METTMNDPFKEIAERAHFNIYHSDLWNGTGRRFAEMIVRECCTQMKEFYSVVPTKNADGDTIHTAVNGADILKNHFGVE